jgi:hypothetical protein
MLTPMMIIWQKFISIISQVYLRKLHSSLLYFLLLSILTCVVDNRTFSFQCNKMEIYCIFMLKTSSFSISNVYTSILLRLNFDIQAYFHFVVRNFDARILKVMRILDFPCVFYAYTHAIWSSVIIGKHVSWFVICLSCIFSEGH